MREENDLTDQAGLKSGNIIVATQGIRVQNFEQYDYARDSSENPELVLIVWQGMKPYAASYARAMRDDPR